jgi:hypothetical protein
MRDLIRFQKIAFQAFSYAPYVIFWIFRALAVKIASGICWLSLLTTHRRVPCG